MSIIIRLGQNAYIMGLYTIPLSLYGYMHATSAYTHLLFFSHCTGLCDAQIVVVL